MQQKKTVLALGFFDGVHLGHQALLRQTRELSDSLGAKAAAITFSAHPDTLVAGKAPALISSLRERETLLRSYGMDEVIPLTFDEALMRMPWRDFFAMLCDRFGAVGFVCGEDFRFGFGGQGNSTLLCRACEDAGLACRIVPKVCLNGTVVSSTHIRALLSQGDIAEANRFLGHPHILCGTVCRGKQLGRTIGFPTANLALPSSALAHGVYACKAITAQGTFPAVTNIGTRPTVDGDGVTAESHLPGFSGDLYGTELTLEFYGFLREERKFPSLAALQAEIRRNTEQIYTFFEKT